MSIKVKREKKFIKFVLNNVRIISRMDSRNIYTQITDEQNKDDR